MSRGLGVLQRAVVDALSDGSVLIHGQIAYRVYAGQESMTRSQDVSLRRAISGLAKRGIIDSPYYELLGYEGPRTYALAERAEALTLAVFSVAADMERRERDGDDHAFSNAVRHWLSVDDESETTLNGDLCFATPANTTLIELIGPCEQVQS